MKISVTELVICLSEVIDLMCEEIRDHHKRVACGAYQLACACGIEGELRRDIVIAAALHDIGGLSLEARKTAALHFEDTNSHAEKGYKLLSVFEPFGQIATIVRYHHTKWNYGKGVESDGQPVSLESQIVLMADRIAVSLSPGISLLNQVEEVKKTILDQEGNSFRPELVEAFVQEAKRDAFWLNIMSQGFYDNVMESLREHDIVLSDMYLSDMLELISNIIDFRSAFTATHSKGVAVVAYSLARLMQMSEEDCNRIKVAALLHDIGKLAVPTEILEKPSQLTGYERDIIRTHSYYTDRVLSYLRGFGKIREWAAAHHENPNGKGYPFAFTREDLSLGCSILKVADIFVALMEDRPYRKGMSIDEAMGILNDMSDSNEIDAKVWSVLFSNIKEINELRAAEEQRVKMSYDRFMVG